MNRELPDSGKLAAMLKFIDSSDQQAWVNVTLAAGRSYNQDPAIFEVVRAWAETYSKRTAADRQRERHNFFEASKQPGGVTIGTVFDLAKIGGWTPALDSAVVTAPAAAAPVRDFVPPVITIDGGISRCEAAPEKNHSQLAVAAKARAALRAVLAYFVYDSSAFEDTARAAFLVESGELFKQIPALERACFEALSTYCTEVSPKEFSTRAFINWASQLGGVVPDSAQAWEAVCSGTDHKPVSNTTEARAVFGTAAAQARLLRLYFMVQDMASEFLRLSDNISDPDEAMAAARAAIGKLQAAASEADRDLEYATGTAIADAARENVCDAIVPERRHKLFLPTGHLALDAHINGYARKEVTLLAAHSGVGKTWYAVDAARLAAAAGYRVLFFSTEMTTGGVAARFGMNINQTSMNHLSAAYQHFGTENNPDCEAFFQHTAAFMQSFPTVTLVSTKRGGLSIEQIAADMARFSLDGPLDLVIVDYLQNVQTDNPKLANAPVYQKVQYVMDRLSALSVEYDACTLATAQLNNPNRKQGSDPTPNLYDIADATSVVRSAAAVMAIYQIAVGEDESGRAIVETRAKVNKARYGTCTQSPLQVKRLVGSRFEFAI